MLGYFICYTLCDKCYFIFSYCPACLMVQCTYMNGRPTHCVENILLLMLGKDACQKKKRKRKRNEKKGGVNSTE